MNESVDHRTVIWTLSASNFVIGMGAFVLIGLVTPIADDLSLTPSRVGATMTTYAIAYAILSPLLVSLTGALGRRRVLTLAMTMFALGSLASATAPNELFLHVSRVIAAAGAGMFTPVTASVASALAPPDKRGKALADVIIGLTVAQVLGVPVGSFIGYTFGWRMGFFIVVLLALPCLWLIWTRVPKGLEVAPASLRQLGRTLLNGPVVLAVLFTASFLGAIYVLYTYLAPLLEQTMGFSRNGVTAALVVFGIGAVLGNVLGGRMSDRLGPVRTLVILCAAQAVITPAFSFLPLPAVAVFVLLGIWSVFGWSFMAGQQVRIIGLDPDAASVILSLNAAAIYVGAAVGSAIGAWVLGAFGIGALGFATGIGALVALGHVLLSRWISGR
ncbi:MFS transporter [Maribius pontilimi]|uniref:MFS transporter n=1 Tax=Palleronia pontilimi TaxID=1964209 RepID=A0A934IFI4_9RHOB|nr:MFS transporter [Palleronia pontilimi]MBJ3761660.1 MFS transporter [Palleronia pontilimi]